MRHWRRRAEAISDPLLRRHALETQRAEHGNLEGAAAFAVLAPRAHRAEVVRATVAFQVAYDYVDSLAEQDSTAPIANGYQLHLALLAALDPASEHLDYYRYSAAAHDDGYLESLAGTCGRALMTLPSYDAVRDATVRAVQRMIVYQSLNHGADVRPTDRCMLASWATSVTPAHSDLRWWETAAGTASSLNVFALFAAACRSGLHSGQADAVELAYFPWIGALHVLLDSLIDRAADIQSGQHSLVDHYTSIEEAAARMSAIAARAVRATEMISESLQHAMILAAMTSFYVSAPCASAPDAEPIARRVLEAMGSLAVPTMVVLRARRAAHGLRAKQRD